MHQLLGSQDDVDSFIIAVCFALQYGKGVD